MSGLIACFPSAQAGDVYRVSIEQAALCARLVSQDERAAADSAQQAEEEPDASDAVELEDLDAALAADDSHFVLVEGEGDTSAPECRPGQLHLQLVAPDT
jgi:hypothetical protein